MEDQVIKTDGELLHCPDCGADIGITEHKQSTTGGEGIAFSYIECVEECGFEAREEWIINETVRI